MEAACIAKNESRFEDIEIDLKNEYLGISSLNNPEALSYFTLSVFPSSQRHDLN